MPTKVSDDAFIAAWNKFKSPQLVANYLKLSIRQVMNRRKAKSESGIHLATVSINAKRGAYKYSVSDRPYCMRRNFSLKDGYLIVFSDAHYWPGYLSLAHQALLLVGKALKPKLIIGNGDLFDGATISRHDVLGWQKLPRVIDEIDEVKTRLAEVRRACPGAQTLATVGNHDSRMDRRLATEVPEFEQVPGMSLQDHLRDWPLSYSVMVNEAIDPTFILHNIKAGIHAPFNNAKAAGCTVITGHLHSQKAQPFTTLLDTWEGIDAGCLADTDSPAFSYAMDRPRDWRSGFVVIKFDKDGRRFPAEFCRIQQYRNLHRAVFRGDIIIERSK